MKRKTQGIIQIVFAVISFALGVFYAIDGSWLCFVIEVICTSLFAASAVISLKNWRADRNGK
jgi:hypothetical protein